MKPMDSLISMDSFFSHISAQTIQPSLPTINFPFLQIAIPNMEADISPTPETLFRPVKRRKFLRRRVDEPEDAQDDVQTSREDDNNRHRSVSRSSRETDAVTEPTTSVTRLRRSYKSRRVGVEFSTSSRSAASYAQPTAEATTNDGEDLKIRAMCDRFTVHTGQKVDVDKHMYCPLIGFTVVHTVMETD